MIEVEAHAANYRMAKIAIYTAVIVIMKSFVWASRGRRYLLHRPAVVTSVVGGRDGGSMARKEGGGC